MLIESGKLAPSYCVQLPQIVPTPTPENNRVSYVPFLLFSENAPLEPQFAAVVASWVQ